MPLFELGFGAGAGALGIADYSVAQRDDYSTVDLRLGLQGQNWTVSLFGSNITDEDYLEEVIPAPEFGGSFLHQAAQSAYGIDLKYRF